MDLTLDLQRAISQIHESPYELCYEFTGAGSEALFWLHAVAGSSRTLLQASDRYAYRSLQNLLGGPVYRSVTPETARAMAAAAYAEATELGPAGPILGVACTAAIATDRERRGQDRACIAVASEIGIDVWRLEFDRTAHDRTSEEETVSRAVLHAVASAAGMAGPEVPLTPADSFDRVESAADDPVAALLREDVRVVSVYRSGTRRALAPPPGVVLSGSFNPLHHGHLALAEAASNRLELPYLFEMSVRNADKPPLSRTELERRLGQFPGRAEVVLTGEPYFAAKATLLPGSTFVVGYDTAVRLLDSRYYVGESGLEEAMQALRRSGSHVLVAGRATSDGFLGLEDLSIPDPLRDLFVSLSEDEFRADVSSTELRAREPRAVQ